MKKYSAILAAAFLFCAACKKEPPDRAGTDTAPAAGNAVTASAAPAPIIAVLPAEGTKENLPGGGWFTWKFSEKPRLGTLIVKVRAFRQDGSRDTALEITGETGMPSMRAHDATAKFVKNKKGDYLMPFDVVMPGEWQVLIRVKSGGKEIYAGKVFFSV